MGAEVARFRLKSDPKTDDCVPLIRDEREECVKNLGIF